MPLEDDPGSCPPIFLVTAAVAEGASLREEVAAAKQTALEATATASASAPADSGEVADLSAKLVAAEGVGEAAQGCGALEGMP